MWGRGSQNPKSHFFFHFSAVQAPFQIAVSAAPHNWIAGQPCAETTNALSSTAATLDTTRTNLD